MCTAVATPTMLPVPMVLARAVHKAAKPEISPAFEVSSALAFDENTSFSDRIKFDT